MNGIIELEKTEERMAMDTWVMRLPDEVCNREGFAAGTLVSLTISNGAITSKFIKPSDETDQFLDHIVNDEREYFEEMKRLGD